MKWRNPEKELPEDNAIVWVMMAPHKYRGSFLQSAASIIIQCGTVNYSNDGKTVFVDNCDEQGLGSVCWCLKQPCNPENYRYEDIAIAWLPVDEMIYPEWELK